MPEVDMKLFIPMKFIEQTGSILDIRRKPNASMVKVFEMVRDKKADAMISAGNSGAFIAAAHLILGEIPGEMMALLDGGANVENSVEDLVQYSKLGSVYMEEVMGIQSPRIGLMNIGVEPSKGKDLHKQAYKQLSNPDFFETIRDSKSELQELLQAENRNDLKYVVINERYIEENNKIEYEIVVKLDDVIFGSGERVLFLTQIRARGFKSFADMTTLDFNHEMIGVVGPNGSGEQSTKSLRGSNMDDIVFSGSADKPAADFAEVTLVFNNKKDTFSNITTDVVEVTRQFDKKKRESSFFINGEKCKLKDIQDIALETGLTKSSIAIISQGTISNFAEAKPETRRELFDEAAGVAKYKKHLDNIKVITDEIGKRLPSLEKQAKKAEMYSTKIKRLGQIEVSILAKDLKIYDVRIKELRQEKSIYDSKIKELSSLINLSQDEFNIMLDESSSSEKEIHELNQRFNDAIKKISSLKVQKQEADNREASSIDTSDKDKFKATQIKKTFDEKENFYFC
ncbi:hypothetical protein FQA39_LY12938 [Lamprigera yunnana]|nr:hypothetical protein FQA39_LY12938 [Lamprigera yunnana]